MKIPIYQIDAFTEKVFGGNPAAVIPLDQWIETDTLQAIALENNLPETVYFVDKKDHFEIRWFTPELEMDLCGHATLAGAYVIFHHLSYDADSILFRSASGALTVSRDGDLITLDFPSRPGTWVDPPQALVKGLGGIPLQVLKSRDYLVIYASESEISTIEPDYNLLNQLDYGTGGIIISAPGDSVDFVSRFFSPGSVIKEDPVTGSAHCTLIPYWRDKLGKSTLHARQISGRGGELFCVDAGDRVKISGRAKTYLIGAITLPE